MQIISPVANTGFAARPSAGFPAEAENARGDALNPSLPEVRQLYFLLFCWLAAVVLVGYFGVGQAVPVMLRGPLVIAGIVLPTLAARFYAPFRRVIDCLPDASIVAFHGWRILAGYAFLFAGAQKLLPLPFVHNAGWGDIAVGAMVPLVLLLPESRKLYLAFHWFGLADFLLAVGTGLYFTLIHHPLQTNLFTFPLVLIPWFGVGLSGASHLLVLQRLLKTTLIR